MVPVSTYKSKNALEHMHLGICCVMLCYVRARFVYNKLAVAGATPHGARGASEAGLEGLGRAAPGDLVEGLGVVWPYLT